MKIETLGGLLKAAERKGKSGARSPFQARTQVYQAMAHYMTWAEELVRSEGPDYAPGTSSLLGSLVHAVAIDAQANLTPEKFALLKDYPLTEGGQTGTLDKEALRDSLARVWGESDVFIERLSGGLFGSYVKALITLKPQARALGHDLSTAATQHIERL